MAKKKQTTDTEVAPAQTAEKKRSIKSDGPKKRRLRQAGYKSFRLQKRIKHPKPNSIPGSFALFAQSVRLLKRNWKLFGALTLLYIGLSLILVKGFGSSTNLPDIKDAINEVTEGSTGQLPLGVALAGTLFTSNLGTSSAVGGAYQSILLVLFSLFFIWALRHVMIDKKPRLKEVLYNSTGQLIQFLAVILVLSVQLLPIAIAGRLYNIIVSGGIAQGPVQAGLFVLFAFFMVLWSLYMLCSSVFALYIVTLPGMQPLEALKSARNLVQYRRSVILRKILFLPFILVLLGAVIMFPIVLVATKAAEPLFYSLTVGVVALVHAYMYNLYRALIK